MKYIVLIVLALLITGCASKGSKDSSQDQPMEVMTIQKEFAPEVWSDHKALVISAADCAIKAEEILGSLSFSQIVKSAHGEYVYAKYSNNRAVIKCLPRGEQSFVYVIVAGPKSAMVEKLRNEIVWQL